MISANPSQVIYPEGALDAYVELRDSLDDTDVLLSDPSARDDLSFLLTIGENSPQVIMPEQANFILSDLRLPKSEQWFSVQEESDTEHYVYDTHISVDQLPTRTLSFSNEYLPDSDIRKPIIYRTRHECAICNETHSDAWGVILKDPSYTQLFFCSEHFLGVLSSLNYLMLENKKLFISELA